MRRFFSAFFFFLVFFLAPLAVQAQEGQTCDCYCRSNGGAQRFSKLESEEACRATCKEQKGQFFLGCYGTDREFLRPENNLLCYSREECESEMVPLASGEEGPSEWGGQAPECLPGSGYCYAPRNAALGSGGSSSVKLTTPIGSLTEASDLGSYVAAVYNFLLIAGAVIAILMLMIGGLQYAASRGNSGAIGKAKERIGSAVFGLVLLLFAYTIATLIDPSLTNFDIFRVPKVKQILYIAKTDDCNYLTSQGLSIIPEGNTLCGTKGRIAEPATEKLKSYLLSTGLAAGDLCTYSTCPSGLSCLKNDDGAYKCVSCRDVTGALGGFATPSANVCSRLTALTKNEEKSFCTFFDASIVSARTDSCVELIYPNIASNHTLDCKKLREDYASKGCGAYDYVRRIQDVNSINVTVDSFLQQAEGANREEYRRIMNLICADDPCGLGPPAGCKTVDKLIGIIPLEQFDCVAVE